jgi:gliding motility-associated-like protein
MKVGLSSLPDFTMALRGILTLMLSLFLMQDMLATHNRAGEITYEHVTGLTYRIRVTTYTKQSAFADRPSIKIRWGDEAPGTEEVDLDSLDRVIQELNVGTDVKRNVYIGLHTYSGIGTFTLSVEDPNRNAGVLNINNGDPGTPEAEKTSTSVMTVFSIRSVLVIRPGNNGHNNSIKFLNPPIQDACIFQPWIHNAVAYDSLNGDELRFSLVPCLGVGALPLNTWESPTEYTDNPNDTFEIDPVTGDITWNTPLVAGEYNVAFMVEEFRNGIFVGSVVRDMQITVLNCSNTPPQIQDIADYCIAVDSLLSFQISYSDPDGNVNQVNVQALGGPLTDVENTAEYNPVTRTFTWVPRCEEVRAQPYIVSFVATDQGNQPLSDVETILITVVAPAVENPEANSAGDHMDLSWTPTPCIDIFEPYEYDDVEYLIYRRNNLFGFDPDTCEVGVPAYTGYSYIGSTEGVNSTNYTDNSVFYGGIYCYMVVTVWPDGALSYASEEFCDTIKKEIPVMTKVSIGITDISTGVDTVHWSPPGDMDTVAYPGPYRYQLYHAPGYGQPTDLIYTSPDFEVLHEGDSTFTHENLNTVDVGHNYEVRLFQVENDSLLSSSSPATSVFLELLPGDNQVELNMNYQVPWTNFEYHIFRKAPGEIDFTEIGIAFEDTYTDTGLVNNQEYCYYVVAMGSFYANNVPDPLVNFSQQDCTTPYDQTPPCPPILSVDHDCSLAFDALSWTNPIAGCDQDITAYNIYYTPVEGGTMELLASISSSGDTTFLYQDEEIPISIAGCFVVTALDSLNLWPDGELHQNESAFSNMICVDNCPIYFLPNIFSPNNDGFNDLFVPFPYRYVESVDFKVFNRWGKLVFETTDPNINWNGVNKDSGNASSDGVYYYVIGVNTIRLSGIVTEEFSGTIQILGSQPSPSTN